MSHDNEKHSDEKSDEQLFAEIHRLAVAERSGSAPEKDDDQLAKLVCDDPRAVGLYATYLLQTVRLRDWAEAESDIAIASVAARPQPLPRDRNGLFTFEALHPRRHPAQFALAALLLTIAGWTVFYAITRPSEVTRPMAGSSTDEVVFVAQLTELQDAVWAEQKSATARGGQLYQAQELQLHAGLVEITYHNGVRVVVAGPAKIIVSEANECILRQGTVFATVPPDARGFAITTPTARVVDFGTEFGVRVQEDGTCEVQVVTGRVVVALSRIPAQQELTAGQSAQVGSGGKFVAQRTDAPLRAMRFVGSLPALPDGDGETIAYQVVRGVAGNQDFSGSLGHDFIVNRPIEVTRLGVFDSHADGLSRPLTAEIWRRETRGEQKLGEPKPGQQKLAELPFTPDDPGELTGGSRFKMLPEPLPLAPGEYTIVAHGYGEGELAFNSGSNDVFKRFKRVNNGGGAITFGDLSRFGDAGRFPNHPDDYIDPARYGAGTFAFRVVENAKP